MAELNLKRCFAWNSLDGTEPSVREPMRARDRVSHLTNYFSIQVKSSVSADTPKTSFGTVKH